VSQFFDEFCREPLIRNALRGREREMYAVGAVGAINEAVGVVDVRADATVLAQQHGRDEKPRDREEQADEEKATARKRQSAVKRRARE
jgi:hypothetical protein